MSEQLRKQQISVGLLAHVDAGKTTLSEGILFESGRLRAMGRVDSRNTFLDNFEMEKKRGITIFSKQAIVPLERTVFTLVDTPGHVDFSTEMERTLQVLDYAVLIISGAEGVQGHTETLWELLKKYRIPTFLFVNKMDMPGCSKEAILKNVRDRLHTNIVDFTETDRETLLENVAVCRESLMTAYLETGEVSEEEIAELIYERELFPCYFGSALKKQGVRELMEGLDCYCMEQAYGDAFGARVYKITRDSQGNRITHLKITGGTLSVKDVIEESGGEKVNGIRIYSGEKYESPKTAEAGMLCAVLGLTGTFAGQGLGVEHDTVLPFLEPVLTYSVLLPSDVSPVAFLPKLRQLEEEDPALHVRYEEATREISVQVMGEVQLEILTGLIAERFGIDVAFGPGKIVYKETIESTVEGVGHFEPLRHYAEVHLLLQPMEEGSGIVTDTLCSEDLLSKNWQRLILTHLEEKKHRGVLTGAPVTDIRITLVAGRAHLKHTEGGDFRQATYRAVRQGLMQAKSVLLEPYYSFTIELPAEHVGRAMADLDRLCAVCSVDRTDGEWSVLVGEGPVSTLNGYQKELTAYTRGHGHFSCVPIGYRRCHNEEEIIAQKGYDPTADLRNTPDSVFCTHGAGFVVPWNEVFSYMHLPAVTKQENPTAEVSAIEPAARVPEELSIGTDEIDAILARTFHANRKDSFRAHKGIARRNRPKRVVSYSESDKARKPVEKKAPYLLVDGYNVIFAWDELKELAAVNLDAARTRLADMLCNYQGIREITVILVFDAYRVKGHETEFFDYHNIHVVYTKEAETADSYIERFAHEHGRQYDITVATSDGLEQIIIIGSGCKRMSSRELLEEMNRSIDEADWMRERTSQTESRPSLLEDAMTEEEKKRLAEHLKKTE